MKYLIFMSQNRLLLGIDYLGVAFCILHVLAVNLFLQIIYLFNNVLNTLMPD